MKEIILNSAYFGIALSILIYFISLKIRSTTKLDFINPLLITIILVIVFLLSFKIDYETYNSSAKYLSYLLTPATVCLAIPLYKQLNLLKKNIKAVIIGISVGVITSLGSIFLMSYLLGLTHEQYVSLLPKSVTTAIGVGISEELGGIPSITIAAIVLTGNLGNLLAVWICKLFKIKEPIAVGLAIGTSSHALGTTKALEIGEVEGAMSSLSIAVAGLLTVVFASVFAMLM